jgi:hypothetical protein
LSAQGAALEPNSAAARRPSIIDSVTQQAKRLSTDVQQTLNSSANTEGGVINQVKGFIHDAFQAPGDSPENTTFAGELA